MTACDARRRDAKVKRRCRARCARPRRRCPSTFNATPRAHRRTRVPRSGVLKSFPGVSPAQDLAEATTHILFFGLVPGHVALVGVATLECVIGLCLITGRAMRVGLWLLTIQFVGILSPTSIPNLRIVLDGVSDASLVGELCERHGISESTFTNGRPADEGGAPGGRAAGPQRPSPSAVDPRSSSARDPPARARPPLPDRRHALRQIVRSAGRRDHRQDGARAVPLDHQVPGDRRARRPDRDRRRGPRHHQRRRTELALSEAEAE